MSSRSRSSVASVIGWIIVALVALWAFGLVLGWIRFVIRSIGLLLLIVVLVVAYVFVKGPPED